MKKLVDKLKKDENIGEQVELKKIKEDMSPRRIFPEDHEAIRILAFEKKMTFIEVLHEIFSYAKRKNYSIDYYKKFEKHKTLAKYHKSVRIPTELNEFINNNSTSEIPAKHLLSCMIQDYIKTNK